MRDVFTEGEWLRLARKFGFTPRELQVARALFDDKTEGEIADELGIRPPTVHKHLEKLRIKTGASTRLSLALRLVIANRQLKREHPPPDDHLLGLGQSDDSE